MSVLNLFGKKTASQKIGGIIKYLSLESFWLSCTKEEQEALIRYYKGGLSTGKSASPIEGDISSSSNTVLKYLGSMIGWAITEKNYILADKMIETGLAYPIRENDLLDAHFFLQDSAECYYKQRDIRTDALEKTVECCRRDISLFPHYAPIMKKEYGSIPRITTISRLITIDEKNGNLPEAIELCKMAIKYELRDNTKGGFSGKLEKLEKLLNK